MAAETQAIPKEQNPKIRGGWIVTAYLSLYAAWLILGPRSELERTLVGNLATIFPALAAASLALWLAGHSTTDKQHRIAWNFMGVGILLWAASNAGNILINLAPSLPDGWVAAFNICSLSGYICALAGLVSYPRPLRRSFTQLRLYGDMLIVTAAIFTFLWLMVIQPLMNTTGHVHLNPFRTTLFPLADLLLLIIILDIFMVSQARTSKAGQRWISLGLGIISLADLAQSYFAVNHLYQTTVSLVDLGRAAGFCAIGLAVLAIQEQPALSPNDTLRLEPGSSQLKSWWRNLTGRLVDPEQAFEEGLQSALPFLATFLLVGYIALQLLVQGQADPLGLWMTVFLGVLLVARQGMRAGEREFRQYTVLVNSIAEPAFICDRKGRLILVNPALLETMGYRDNDLLEQPMWRLLPPNLFPDKVLQTGLSQGWSGEATFLRKNGSTYPVYLSLRPIQPARSDKLAMAGTAHDLTLQKSQQDALRLAYKQVAAAHHALEMLNEQLEQKVDEKTRSLIDAYKILEQQNQTLQMLDELKSDFVSLVSHELRAPLTNISGGIELVLGSHQMISPKAHQSLELVQVEIRRLTHFVETILDLSALDAGRMPLSPAPLSIPDIIEIILQEIKTMPGAERVCWEIPPDLPFVHADERALVSIFFHLIDNANKYAPSGLITVRAEETAGQMRVQVLDQGPGIPDEALPLLFGKFYRLHHGDAQTVYGHGLGLYIVRRLLQAMQGDIEFNNRPEGGACFTFWLPIIEEKDERETAAGG